jgi:hypothetical protein
VDDFSFSAIKRSYMVLTDGAVVAGGVLLAAGGTGCRPAQAV